MIGFSIGSTGLDGSRSTAPMAHKQPPIAASSTKAPHKKAEHFEQAVRLRNMVKPRINSDAVQLWMVGPSKQLFLRRRLDLENVVYVLVADPIISREKFFDADVFIAIVFAGLV